MIQHIHIQSENGELYEELRCRAHENPYIGVIRDDWIRIDGNVYEVIRKEFIEVDRTIRIIVSIISSKREISVRVYGNRFFTKSNEYVREGEELILRTSGKIIYDKKGNECGPGGADWCDTHGKMDPYYEKAHGGLLGKIGDEIWYIGDSTDIVCPSSGKLEFGINDAHVKGNSGTFNVVIERR